MAETVTWVRNADSQYEISSEKHLLQLMHRGGLYTDAGTHPTDYWGASTYGGFEYIQTAYIDLSDDHANIQCIGNASLAFSGVYDGNYFSISNWAHTDASNSIESVGLFGKSSVATLQHIRLKGVWSLAGFSAYAGFLCGEVNGSNIKVFDIEADFSAGTILSGGSTNPTLTCAGTLFGRISACQAMAGVTLRGTVDLVEGVGARGGIAGGLYTGSLDMIRNCATFTNGIAGTEAGGILGWSYSPPQLTKCVNAMQGNISATDKGAGGICGYIMATNSNLSVLVNCMHGQISSSSGSKVGGIFGHLNAQSETDLPYMINYMTGDISSSVTNSSGGIIGYMDCDWNQAWKVNITNSIIAMNGYVKHSIRGTEENVTPIVDLTVDTSFGMTYTNNNYGGTATLTAYTTDPTFTDLPYVDVGGVDIEGNVYEWDFVFANLAGNASYSEYTHLALHKGDVSAPFYADFDIPDSSTTVYLTYGNVQDGSLFTTESLTVNASSASTVYNYSKSVVMYSESMLVLTPGPINILVGIDTDRVLGASAFRLTYQDSVGGGEEIVAATDFIGTSKNIKPLLPETLYDVRFYVDTSSGSGFELVETKSTITVSDLLENYNTDHFLEEGVFNFAGLDETSASNMAINFNDLFETGDVLRVDIESKPELDATFVRTGESLTIGETDALLLPFEELSGASQTVNLTLSDNSTSVLVAYDEASNNIAVSSAVHSVGDTFVLDGKKVVVHEF